MWFTVDMRTVILLCAVVLPMPLKRAVYNRVLRWRIDPGAVIKYSFIDVDFLEMGAGSFIGNGNIVRGLSELRLETNSYIKNFNQLLAHDLPNFPERRMTVGVNSRIMSRHFFDVSGTIEIGSDCVIGGRDTQMWSHSRFTRDGIPSLEPRTVHIGDRVYVGARVTLIHCQIAATSVVGAGAVVTKSFSGENLIIAGNPATAREPR